MINEIRYPDKRLAEYIKFFWILDFTAPIFIQPVTPTGESQILFHYKEPFRQLGSDTSDLSMAPRQPASVICGQVTSLKRVLSSPDTGVIGVIFHPHTARAFFRMNMQELADMSVEAPLISPELAVVEQKVAEASDTDTRIKLIEQFFLKQLEKSAIKHFDIIKHAVSKITGRKGLITVSEILSDINLTQRHYERLFSNSVGISCKRFIEITKFNHALSLMDLPLSLSDIAYDAGYYDQSHFIRSFKKYAGASPKAVRAGKLA